jgi:2-polyprenyl-3-methyl-5-hydroxy-6-metoxy-1,4-benzoquinol methylase
MMAVPAIPTCIVDCFHCGSPRAAHLTYTRDYNYKTCSNEFEFVRCLECGQVYLKNRPALSALSIIYPEAYEAYAPQIEARNPLARIKRHFIRKKLKSFQKHCPVNGLIMEVGCGSGDLLRLVKRHGDPTWKLFGVDINDTHFSALRAAGIAVFASRFEDMDGFEGMLDIIVMNQVIEHLADPDAIIRKAKSMLREGGVLIMETPSLESWDAVLFAKHGLWEGWHAPRHWQVFDKTSLSATTAQCGLRVIGTTYILSPYLWVYSVKNFLEFHQCLSWLRNRLTLQNVFALAAVSMIDVMQLMVTGKTSNMRVIAQKQ